MRPVPHPMATRRIGPPRDWDKARHGECGAVEVADLATTAGPFMEILWRPAADELERLNNGGAIALGIRGDRLPVHYLAVTAAPQHDGAQTPGPNQLLQTLMAAGNALRLYQAGRLQRDLAEETIVAIAAAVLAARHNPSTAGET